MTVEEIKISCPSCALVAPPEIRLVGPHIGAYCVQCKSYIKWIPKKDAHAFSPPKEDREKQACSVSTRG